MLEGDRKVIQNAHALFITLTFALKVIGRSCGDVDWQIGLRNSFQRFTSAGNTGSFSSCPDGHDAQNVPRSCSWTGRQRFVQDAKRMPCVAERHRGGTQALFMKTGAPGRGHGGAVLATIADKTPSGAAGFADTACSGQING